MKKAGTIIRKDFYQHPFNQERARKGKGKGSNSFPVELHTYGLDFQYTDGWVSKQTSGKKNCASASKDGYLTILNQIIKE